MHETSAAPAVHHGPPTTFLRKHVFSLDHKVIGLQYYALALVAVITGMVLSWVMRIHLGWTNAAIPGLHALSPNGAPGGVMTPEFYLQLMTMHATIMVFFVLTTAPFAAFGNYFLPIQVGAEDMPFPHFNMMSFWTTFTAFLVLVAAFFVSDGPPLSGWTEHVITPEAGVRAVDGLLTGLHEPKSSHLMMLTAIAGTALLEETYTEALREHYLWHEFGDLNLILTR